MKTHSTITYIVLLGVMTLMACKETQVRHSIPQIESLTLSREADLLMPDTLYINAKLTDQTTPLSTLEIELIAHGKEVSRRSIRTKGHEVSLAKEPFFIPFAPGIKTGDELTLRFILINVDGNEAVIEKKLSAIRPEIPESLFFVTADNVIEFKRSKEQAYLYIADIDNIEASYTGKMATDMELGKAQFVWNGTGKENVAGIGKPIGEDIKISYPTWVIDRLIFDALNFKFSVEGIEVNLLVKDVQLSAQGDYFFAKINFKKNEEISIVGLEADKLQTAYNRDFFEYNDATGKFKFLRESGVWEVYYSLNLNFLWVMRLSDVAPDCYWVVGHGFTCAPVWNDFYSKGGWAFDVNRIGYAVRVDKNKYQLSLYLSTNHEWKNFEFEVYSNLNWGKENGIEFEASSILGDKKGFEIPKGEGYGLTNGPEFVPGFYRLTFDTSAGTKKGEATVTIKRIAD